MSHSNILFYSKYCDRSKSLIQLLENEQLLSYFHKVCIDDDVYLKRKIPMTPVLIIRGVSKPYVASDAFIWLSKMRQCKLKSMIESHDAKIPWQTFNPHEMTQLDDNYTLIDQDSAFPQAFASCHHHAIIPCANRVTDDSKIQEEQYLQMMQARQAQDQKAQVHNRQLQSMYR